MSCDFKIGDEVFCLRPGRSADDLTVPGSVYVVERVWFNPHDQQVALGLVGLSCGGPGTGAGFWGYRASRFRKVERRTDKQSLTEWLSQPSGDTDHLDKPLPAKKRERAQ